MKYAYIGAVLTALILMAACATGEGQVFEAVVEAEAGNAEPSATVVEEEDEDNPVLRVESRPSDAEVYLNGELVGETPVSIERLEPGNYRLTVSRSGYYAYRRWIEIGKGQRYVISVGLEQITGFLAIDSSVADAEITVEGTKIGSGVTELPVGRYTVRARAFGYESITTNVTIREDRTAYLDLEFEEARFEIEDLLVSRPRFAPANPGVLGQTAVSFTVTAPGEGTATVYGADGKALLSEDVGPFTTWEERWVWDGTNAGGSVVPDGKYVIEVTGRSSWNDEPRSVAVAATIVVDSSLVIRYYGSLGTTVGTLYATVPEVLPAGSFQFTASLIGHRGSTSVGVFGRFPLSGTLRVGLPWGMEAVASGTAVLYDTVSYTRGVVGLSLRYELPEAGRLSSAIGLRGTFQSRTSGGSLSGPDSFAAYIGGGALLPVSYSLGSFDVVLTPELVVSPVPVADEAAPIGWYAWSYLRGGLRYDAGTFGASVSGAVRTAPFSQSLALEMPFQIGADAHLMIPGTPLYISTLLVGEFDPVAGYYLMGGGALGLVY